MRALITAGRRRNKLLALAIAAAPFFICSTASADRWWINGVTVGNWSAAADWNATTPAGSGGAGVPGSSDNVNISNVTGSNYNVTLNQTDTVASLQIAAGAVGLDTLSQTSGTLTVSGSESIGGVERLAPPELITKVAASTPSVRIWS